MLQKILEDMLDGMFRKTDGGKYKHCESAIFRFHEALLNGVEEEKVLENLIKYLCANNTQLLGLMILHQEVCTHTNPVIIKQQGGE